MDLEGCRVRQEGTERDFGVVSHLYEMASQDIMVVQGDETRHIPFVKGDVVKKVDLEARQLVVDWPEVIE